jgi:hypothetical protein
MAFSCHLQAATLAPEPCLDRRRVWVAPPCRSLAHLDLPHWAHGPLGLARRSRGDRSERRCYLAGRKATWSWRATPGGGTKPRIWVVL